MDQRVKKPESSPAIGMSEIMEQLNKLTVAFNTQSVAVQTLNQKRDKIQDQSAVVQTIVQKMDKFQEEIRKQIRDDNRSTKEELDVIADMIKKNIEKQTADMIAMKDEITQLHVVTQKREVKVLELTMAKEKQNKHISMVEEENRRANLVIWGISEENPDNLKDRVMGWLNQIGTTRVFHHIDFISIFRIGFKHGGGPIRNVLIRFASVRDKLMVFEQIKASPETALKFEGKDIEVYNDINHEERAWRYVMKPITKVLRDHEIRYNWRFPQQLRFFYNHRMHNLDADMDAAAYLHRLGLITLNSEMDDINQQIFKNKTGRPRTATFATAPGASTSSTSGQGAQGEDTIGRKRKSTADLTGTQKAVCESTTPSESSLDDSQEGDPKPMELLSILSATVE